MLLFFHLQTKLIKFYMMAAIIRLGLRSSLLVEARSALVTASAASSRLFSTSRPESRLLQTRTCPAFTFLVPSFTQQTTTSLVRSYSSEYPVDIQMIKDRCLLVLRLYDKINPEKVTHLTLQQCCAILPVRSSGVVPLGISFINMLS